MASEMRPETHAGTHAGTSKAAEEQLSRLFAGRNVDLVVLNRAPATVGAAALLTGRLLAVNDQTLYLRSRDSA